jgi:hypothetical protein
VLKGTAEGRDWSTKSALRPCHVLRPRPVVDRWPGTISLDIDLGGRDICLRMVRYEWGSLNSLAELSIRTIEPLVDYNWPIVL